jgi:tetratricopeptide (TPR) repeat protein
VEARFEGKSSNAFTEFLTSHPDLGTRVLELNSQGQELLEQGRIKRAERKFKEAVSLCSCAIPAINNLALCAYLKDDFRGGVEYAKKCLKYDPENVFAHSTLAQCYFNLGERARAEAHAERAVASLQRLSSPQALNLLNKVFEALAELEWDERIYELYIEYKGEEDLGLALDAVSWVQIGVAAANLGHLAEAERMWQRALELAPDLRIVKVYLSAARHIRAGRAPACRFPYSFGWELEGTPPTFPEPREEIKPAVIQGIWDGEDKLRHGIVDMLAGWDDPWAEEFLRLMLIQPGLPDELKLHAADALADRGAIAEGEVCEIHLDGGIKRLKLFRADPEADPPPEAVELLLQGLELEEAGKLPEAEAAYLGALEIFPPLTSAMVALARIYEHTDRDQEAEQLLKVAFELGNEEAGLGLAVLYLKQDELEEAVAVLEEVIPGELHQAGVPLYWFLRGWVHLALGELEEAKESLQEFLDLTSEEEAKAILDETGLLERMDEQLARLRELEARRRRRYLSRPVHPGMPLKEALVGLTKNQLVGVAKWLGLPYSRLRKQALASRIARYIQDYLSEVVQALPPEAREALTWVADQGGSVALSSLFERYGDIEEDSIDWQWEFPSSIVGRLQLAGLLHVGKVASGEELAVLPKEIITRLPSS